MTHTQINREHSSLSKGSNLNETLLPIKHCSCFFPVSTSPSLCSIFKGKVEHTWQNDTQDPTRHIHALLLQLRQDSVALPPPQLQRRLNRFLRLRGMGKISIKVQGKEQQHKSTIIIFGMAMLKYTANSPICIHAVFKWQNKKVSASVGQKS